MNIHCPTNNPMMGSFGVSNFENSPIKNLSYNHSMMGPYRISSFENTDINPLSNLKTEGRHFSDCSSDSGHSFISADSFSSTIDSKKSGLNNIKHSSSVFINTKKNQNNKIHQVGPIIYSSFPKKNEGMTAIAGKTTQDHAPSLQGNTYSQTMGNDFNQPYTRIPNTRHSTTPTARATTNPPKNNPIGNSSATSHHFLNSKIRPENIDLLLCSSFKDKRDHTVRKPTVSQSDQIIGNQNYTVCCMSSFILDAHQCFVGKVEAACYYDQQGNLCKIESKNWPIVAADQPTGVKSYSFKENNFILKEFNNNEEVAAILKQNQPEPSGKKVNSNTAKQSKSSIKTPLDYFNCYSDSYRCERIGDPQTVHYNFTGKDPIRNCKSSQWDILDPYQGKIAEVELVVQYNDKTKQDDLVYCNLNTDLIKPLGSHIKLDKNLNPLDYLKLRLPGMTVHSLHDPQYILFKNNQAIAVKAVQFDWDIKSSKNLSTGNIKMIFGWDAQQNQIKLLKCRYEGLR